MSRQRPHVRALAIAGATVASIVAGCAGGTSVSPSASVSPPASVAATAAPADSPTPAPSPTIAPTPPRPSVGDGELWLVYQWVRGDGDGVYLMRPDGSDVHLLMSDDVNTLHPDWSPDGTRIAFEASGSVSVADAEGSGSTVLVDRFAECEPVCGDVDYPAWSPDGTKVAVSRVDIGLTLIGSSIVVVDVASGDQTVVYEAPEHTVVAYPRWSGDGRSLVFSSFTYSEGALDGALGSTISVIDLGDEAAAPRVLTDPGMFASYPDWHPTDDLILFTTYDLGEFQGTDEPTNLYTIRPDGTEMTQLTTFGPAGERATQPTWTPDGQRIVFTLVSNAADFDRPRQAAFIDADGTGLTEVPGSATHPRLRPIP